VPHSDLTNTALTAPVRTATVRARHASSLIVLRGTAPEMLMGMRGAGHRFMPNRLVFPGGAVDRADFTAPVVAPLPAHVEVMLAKSAKPRLVHGLAVAAARELEEETGLSLGVPADLSGFDYLGRAITPPDSPVRFNARFFTVGADAVGGELAGSGELEGLRWYGVDEALALDLARPTRAVIGLLQEWLVLTPTQRAARTQTPVMRMRNWGIE
jgi:8-oxo-dGTP pyrophosphatase MutT (NUDIX family)